MPDVKDLSQLVGKTFERDGERFEIEEVDNGYNNVPVIEIVKMRGAKVRFRYYDVPHSMLRLWLAGAVEVEEGK